MASSDSSSGGVVSKEPAVWAFAGVILLAVLALALLRHFFGSIKVDFSAGSK